MIILSQQTYIYFSFFLGSASNFYAPDDVVVNTSILLSCVVEGDCRGYSVNMIFRVQNGDFLSDNALDVPQSYSHCDSGGCRMNVSLQLEPKYNGSLFLCQLLRLEQGSVPVDAASKSIRMICKFYVLVSKCRDLRSFFAFL